jgi:hypothetical protein
LCIENKTKRKKDETKKKEKSKKKMLKNGTILFTLTYLFIALIVKNGINAQLEQSSSDLPPPPQKPDKFTSKQQLKEYLVKLHEYYAIIGRPRFGRRSYEIKQEDLVDEVKSKPDSTDETLQANEISNENMAYLLPNSFKSTENSISFIFELLDSNKDGLITKSEFLKFFKNLSQQN